MIMVTARFCFQMFPFVSILEYGLDVIYDILIFVTEADVNPI